jgi:hypothetical protein
VHAEELVTGCEFDQIYLAARDSAFGFVCQLDAIQKLSFEGFQKGISPNSTCNDSLSSDLSLYTMAFGLLFGSARPSSRLRVNSMIMAKTLQEKLYHKKGTAGRKRVGRFISPL